MQQPDIIFIVLDTQRVDRLGCYGYQAREPGASITPNLDAFAGRGALFEQAVAPAQWTIPSHASMFTGLYPTAHQVTQSNHSLGPDRPHLAEVLRAAGYQTIGFCNNPLVGILNNGFKRGFQTFYNYGGAIPSLPQDSTSLPWPVDRLLEGYTQFLRRISYPIQNFFGRSDLAFRVSLNAWLTPLWSKMANFKGQNERSVRDVDHFLQEREKRPDRRPLFLFLNLMETHLPFWPPGEFVDRVAPYMRTDREARTIMRRWNREAYRWAAPLGEPLGELESRVLNDMYDAEVAYQDDYLGRLLTTLQERANAGNTLTVMVADHGDGLGDHQFFGHAFIAYQELVHVPLILHWPQRLPPGRRLAGPVSTRRIYHTVLDAAGPLPAGAGQLDPVEVHGLTLLETVHGRDPEQNTAFAEIYPPLNLARAVQHRQPELLERFRCMVMRRAVVKNDWKLIHVSEWPDELFDLAEDPLELTNRLPERPAETASLSQEINRLAHLAEAQRERLAAGASLDLEADEHLLQRLQGLGYIE
ncbi:MAG: sulfatase-like hydrolase/transferase [Chloroflexi bacterium]|nr:sulfatase-like hydrolase/transferase [Chloroflexota bacterium]